MMLDLFAGQLWMAAKKAIDAGDLVQRKHLLTAGDRPSCAHSREPRSGDHMIGI